MLYEQRGGVRFIQIVRLGLEECNLTHILVQCIQMADRMLFSIIFLFSYFHVRNTEYSNIERTYMNWFMT